MKLKNLFYKLSICYILCFYAASSQAFTWTEATIDELHQALRSKEITCEQVVQGYLDRIEQFDRQGPAINSLITINPLALEHARALDRQTDPQGALYCVPVVVKDNINVADMPTTLGAIALKDSHPPQNASVVQNLIDQGAIVLAKTNLDEFAIAMLGLSSAGGQTRNVYILDNGPGGSSGGSGSAVSASFAMAGLGTDTGGSIRIPAALAGLVGVRPTKALADISGIAPLSSTQDTVGPMCRTMRDCVYMLRFTESYSTPERQQQLLDALDENGLQGVRIAMVSGMFPKRTPENEIYWMVIDQAIAQMREAGATIDIIELPEQEKILNGFVSLARYEIKEDLTRYLLSWPSDQDHHLRSYEEILQSKGYAPSTEQWLTLYNQTSDNRMADPVYIDNTHGRQEFIRAHINQVLNGKTRYDALMYPTLTQLNVPIGNNTEGRKNVSLSAFSGLPAISFPAGMTQDEHPQPVALEVLGREFDEPTLIRIVYGYETKKPVRVAPSATPPLDFEK